MQLSGSLPMPTGIKSGPYNYAEFMPERKRMMEAWVDYLNAIKAGAKIIPIRTAG